MRIDSTVTETHILEPSDSRLLYDGVRVLTRLLRGAAGGVSRLRRDRSHVRAALTSRRAVERGRSALIPYWFNRICIDGR